MRASRLLILAFISIIESGAAENFHVKRETRLPSAPSRYPKPPAMLEDERYRVPHLYNSPDKILEKEISHRRQGHKKVRHWSEPILYKKPRGHKKRLHRRRRPKKHHHPAGKRPNKVHTKNPRYSNVPSTFLEPPRKSLKSSYDLYSPTREIPLSDQPNNNLDPTPTTDSLKNHRLHGESEKEGEEEEDEGEESEDNERPPYVRDHAPEQQVDATGDIETNDEKSSDLPESPKDRIDFHIQGHEGPETYIFGFDTGNGNNRQFRLEERHGDGSVTGHYGYVDARGKLRKIRYEASPSQGYVEKPDVADEQKD